MEMPLAHGSLSLQYILIILKVAVGFQANIFIVKIMLTHVSNYLAES